MSNNLIRIEEKLKKSKENKNFYEAHQLYTTLYYRYSSKERCADARKLMKSGAIFLIENAQSRSGVQLALLYVESLEKTVKEIKTDDIADLAELHALIPDDLVEKETFEKRAVLWSASCLNVPKCGDAQLRKFMALNYWKTKVYSEARQHFMYSDDGTRFGEMLQEFALHHGLPGEIDLFVAQAVLQLLSLKKEKVANDVFVSYTTLHPKVGNGPPFQYPLINFICCLLIAVKDKGFKFFETLCNLYQPVIQRDVLFIDYLERIAELYFGVVSAKKKKDSGIIESLMQSIFEDEPSMPQSDEPSLPPNSRILTVEDLD